MATLVKFQDFVRAMGTKEHNLYQRIPSRYSWRVRLPRLLRPQTTQLLTLSILLPTPTSVQPDAYEAVHGSGRCWHAGG